MPNRLGIHVIGPRYGEYVVLELPDESVAVLDSFGDRRGTSPILAFLREHFPNLEQVEIFFGVTHPHADHCFFASELAREVPTR